MRCQPRFFLGITIFLRPEIHNHKKPKGKYYIEKVDLCRLKLSILEKEPFQLHVKHMAEWSKAYSSQLLKGSNEIWGYESMQQKYFRSWKKSITCHVCGEKKPSQRKTNRASKRGFFFLHEKQLYSIFSSR